MSRALNDLAQEFRPLAFELLARFTEAQIRVLIVGTGRTLDEQKANVAKGVSWTLDSYHLRGLAIDVAPFQQGSDKLNWDASDPIWLKMGQIGESIGLTWGGRWLKTPDLGHFQMKLPSAGQTV